MDGRQPDAGHEEGRARVEREGVGTLRSGRGAGDLPHELPRHALRRQVRRDPVRAIRVRLAPRLEQVGRLRQADALVRITVGPRELLEPLDDVVRVAEAHPCRLPELLEPPRPGGLDQEHADDTGRAGSEQGAERSRRGADVALALFLDQHVLEGQVAVAGEVDEPETVALEDPGALRADVDGCRDRMGPGKLAANLIEARD